MKRKNFTTKDIGTPDFLFSRTRRLIAKLRCDIRSFMLDNCYLPDNELLYMFNNSDLLLRRKAVFSYIMKLRDYTVSSAEYKREYRRILYYYNHSLFLPFEKGSK